LTPSPSLILSIVTPALVTATTQHATSAAIQVLLCIVMSFSPFPLQASKPSGHKSRGMMGAVLWAWGLLVGHALRTLKTDRQDPCFLPLQNAEGSSWLVNRIAWPF
jgi:DMSO/TMAO reductase YedYZ heme-binding membrane subunit